MSDTRAGAARPDPGAVVALALAVLNSSDVEKGEVPDALRAVPGFEDLLAQLWAVRELALALARGELNYHAGQRGFVIGALKELQADLRHLTWQTQRIAAGQFQHRVHFLGDFSTAFNQMAARLQGTVRELEDVAARYKRLSEHDGLTGLYSRSAFETRAVELLGREPCASRPSTLIMGDIDFFKRINDTWGHPCGDKVLRAFADILREGLRPGDLCCRYGGEEFLVLLPGLESQGGSAVAERLRRAVESTAIRWADDAVQVTVSFGICPMAPPGESGMSLERLRDHIQAADCCLYLSKRNGRNKVICQGREYPDGTGTLCG